VKDPEKHKYPTKQNPGRFWNPCRTHFSGLKKRTCPGERGHLVTLYKLLGDVLGYTELLFSLSFTSLHCILLTLLSQSGPASCLVALPPAMALMMPPHPLLSSSFCFMDCVGLDRGSCLLLIFIKCVVTQERCSFCKHEIYCSIEYLSQKKI